MEAASPRLSVSATGRIPLTPGSDAELTLRFTDTSLDPYVRAFEPRLSPFTTAVVSGSVRVVGDLSRVEHLLVDGTVDRIDLRLFDYALAERWPDSPPPGQSDVVQVEQMRLVGENTSLDVNGTVGLADRQIALHATGDANLSILQGFFRDIRSSGQADLAADVRGPPRQAGLCRQRLPRGRPHPALRVPALAGCDERPCHVRCGRRATGRSHGAPRWRPRAVRRPHRSHRIRARRPGPDRARRRHAPSLPGRVPVRRRRRPGAARTRRGTYLERFRAREERGVLAAVRDHREFSRARRAPRPDCGAGRDHGVPSAVRRAPGRAVHACASRTTCSGSSPAPT